MNTRLIFKEVLGECISIGDMEVTHSFTSSEELIAYIRENWFNLEEAKELESVEINLHTKGDFLLIIKEMTDE